MRVWISRLTTVLLIAVMAFVLFLGYGLINNRWYHVLVVEGGSMEPSIHYGDLLVVSKPPADLKPGMVVTLNVDGQLVTHRVVSVNPLITKGDANETIDKWKPEQVQVVGLVRFSIPRLGKVIQRLNVAQQNATAAYMSSRASTSLTIGTGTWEELGTTDLALSPGCSQAVRPSNVPLGPASFPIASMDGTDQLKLDFGEVNPGDDNNSPDVFRIKNLGTADVEVDIAADGDFKAFVGRIALGGDTELPGVLKPGSITLADDGLPATLAADEQRSVAIDLRVPKTTAPGDYTGIIQVTATDGSYSKDIPVTLTVKARVAETRLALTLGDSKAYDGNGHAAHTSIASLDEQGKLKLDFGQVIPPENGESSDVFRIKNLGTQPVEVSVAASGDFAGLTGRIRVVGDKSLPVVIEPGHEERVAIKLDVAKDAKPGEYEGIVQVRSTDDVFSEDIPVILTVIDKGCGKDEPIAPTVPQLVLSPGDSRAVRLSDGAGEPSTFVIAIVKAEALRLDFGDVAPGDSMKSANVFEVNNAGLEGLEVDIVALGEFKDFVQRITLGGHKPPQVLDAGDERSVAMDLDIPKDARAGEYSGTVRVSAADGSFSMDIPVVLRVVETEKAPADKEDEIAPEDPPVDPDPVDPVPPEPVATQLSLTATGGGALRLDFGEVTAGDNAKSGNAFTIKNDGSQDARVTVVAKGDFKSFVHRIRLGSERASAVLAADEATPLAIDLKIPEGATPGDYSGTIRVTSDDGTFSADIPVSLTVVAEADPPEETPPEVTPPADEGDADSGDGQEPAPKVEPPSDKQPPDQPADPPADEKPDKGNEDGSQHSDPPPSDPGPSEGESSPPAATGSG